MKLKNKLIFWLLLACVFPAISQAGIIDDLKDEGALVFYVDFRSGTLNDLVDGLSPTIAAPPIWYKNGIHFTGNGRIVYVDGRFSPTSELSIISLVEKIKNDTISGVYQDLANIHTAATNIAEFYSKPPGGTFTSFQGSYYAVSPEGYNCLGVSHTQGSKPEFYYDGAYVGLGNVTVSLVGSGDRLTVGNYRNGGYPVEENYRACLFFNKALSQAEHTQVYNELIGMHWPSKPYSRGGVQFKTDWGVHESISTEGGAAGDFLADTPFKFGDASGRFKVSSDTIDGKTVKVIECTTAGLLYLPITSLGQMTPTETAYGTWEFWIKKTDASTLDVAFIAPNKNITAGYGVNISSTEAVTLQEYAVGAVSGPGGSITAATWTQIRVTRSGAGVFSVYIDGVSIGSGTDTTTTSAEYLTIDIDAGDFISWSDVSGDHSLFKMPGVVAP